MDPQIFIQAPVAAFIFALTIATSLLAWYGDESLYRRFILHPYSLVRENTWYTLLTSGLIHGDGFHLIFNMVTFWYFAFRLEINYVGHWQFLVLYVAGLALSDITTVLRHRNDPDYYCLGASGAVTAVLFSFIIFRPQSQIGLLVIPIYVPAPVFAVLYIAFSCYAARGGRGHINHEAHLWGAVTGLLFTLIVDPSACVRFLDAVRGMVG